MERPKRTYFCNKCGYFGETSEHEGCGYVAVDSFEQRYIDQLEKELTSLRAFKAACEGQETQINLEAEIHKISTRFLSKRHQGYFMGDIRALLALQAPSDPEAANLRMRIEELENSSIAYVKQVAAQIKQLEDNRAARDQQVAEACANYMTSQRYMVLRPCEAVTPEASVARIESSVKSLARGITRGEWKKHMKPIIDAMNPDESKSYQKGVK